MRYRPISPRERVETSLRDGHSDRVPYTVYENKIPQCSVERRLRNRGLCIVKRDVPVFKVHRPHVNVSQAIYWKGEKKFARTLYQTPVGDVSTLSEEAGFTAWGHERMFKTPDDYKVMLFLIKDEFYQPNYQAFAQAQQAFGDDAIFRANIGLEPLQALVSGELMGMQDFCEQWMENRDELLRLYEAIVDNRRKIYPIVAQSPALHVNYGGNVTPEITGLPVFQQYYVPHYNEAAEILHQHGKLIGCHFDGNCRLLSATIASTDLDYIEAFTPAPDTDMTLAQARAAWPDKVLWINFPSSQHLKSDREIIDITFNLLTEAGTVDGLIMGVTEDVPQSRWQQNYQAILHGLFRHAESYPGLYAPAS